ncbi:hypothetical protein JCM10450v2_008347 [Rhodotorula kratochvilovae]
MGLSQRKVSELFARCESPEETEEVLQAYAFAKWNNGGNQHQVLRKLHLLTLYLRAVDMGPKLRDHYQAFAIAATMTKTHSAPLVLLPTSTVGLEAWNAARRPSKSLMKRAFIRSNVNLVAPSSPAGSGSASDAEMDRAVNGRVSLEVPAAGGGGGFAGWLGGRRSRSGTVTAVVLAPGESTEQHRRAAGAGGGLLGTGLLSAPPNYDPAALTSYVESNPSLRTSTREYDPELDLLPDYA